MKFSIIVPVYNVAPYLNACLDSVRAQTIADWECICVDDGSSDGSGEILEEYAGRDSRFGVIHKDNGGVSAARNAALEIARGDWIVFVDSDDVIARDWLKAIDVAAGKTNVDWIKLECVWWRSEDCEAPDLHLEVRDDIQLEFCRPAELFKRLQGQAMPFQHVYRRNTIGKRRFDVRCNCCEDEIYLLQMQAAVSSACIVPYRGYYYRVRKNSLSKGKIDPSAAVGYLEALTRVLKGASVDPQTLTRIVNASFCSCLGRGLCRGARRASRDARRMIFLLWRTGLIRLSCVPRVIDRCKWLFFMLTGVFPNADNLKRLWGK